MSSRVNCCVPQCKSVYKNNRELTFHHFPNDGQRIEHVDDFGTLSTIDRRKMWMIKLRMGKRVTKNMRVCSRHFEDEDFITPSDWGYKKRYLKKSAIPRKHLPTSTINTNFKNYKLKEKSSRLERLMKRRQVSHSPHVQAQPNEDNNILSDNYVAELSDNLENVDNSFGRNDAAKVLLSFQQPPNYELIPMEENFTQGKTFADCATQTEICFNNLKPTNETGVQVNTAWFSVADFVTTDRSLNILTGISTLRVLHFLVNVFSTFKNDRKRQRLTVKDRILLVFLKLKLDLSYSALGILFGDLSVTSVKRIFVNTVQVLADILKIFIYLPSKESVLMNMPRCFKKYQKVRIVLDCTEIPVQVPKKLCCRIKLYSHYKKRHTLKFMTGVTPSGFISYISPCYGGRSSDKSIFEQSGLIKKLEPYLDQVMVDKGFLIDTICNDHGISIVRPPFLRKKKQFNRNEALENRSIASARVHIERVNARIKIFRILKNTFPLHLMATVNDIFTVICAIVNLSKPVMRDELFLNE